MSYSSSVTTVLQKCPEFTHFNLIATWKLSWFVLSTNYLRRCHNFPFFRSCDFYWNKRCQNNKRVYKDFFNKRRKRLSHLCIKVSLCDNSSIYTTVWTVDFTFLNEHTVATQSFMNKKAQLMLGKSDRTACQWSSKSSKVDDFHVIWKPIWDFLSTINSNLGPISHRLATIARNGF